MALTKVDVNMMEATGLGASKYLKGDGTWGTVASSGFVEMKVYTAASSVWTKPADVTKVVVEVQGAGGGLTLIHN